MALPPDKTGWPGIPARSRNALNAVTDGLVRGSGWRALALPERLVHAGVAVLAGVLLAMATIDRPLALYMKRSVTGDTLALWHGLTQFGDATGYVIVAVFVLIASRILQRVSAHEATAGVFETIQRYCGLLLAALAVSGLAVNVLKPLVGRLRPRYLFESGIYGFHPFNLDMAANTFPSGHAQVIWVVATVLCLAWPRHRLLFCVLAATVAFSRVIISAHFFSDVMAGSYLGIASVLLLAPAILRWGKEGDQRPGETGVNGPRRP